MCIHRGAAAAVIGIGRRRVRADNVATEDIPLARDVLRARSWICASRLRVRRTAADIRVAARGAMEATVRHRQATVDRTQHPAMVVRMGHLVTAAEAEAMVAAAMRPAAADIPPVVDTLAVVIRVVAAVAAATRVVVAAIPAVIARADQATRIGVSK